MTRGLLGILLIAGCGSEPVVQPADWTQADGLRFRSLTVGGGPAGFEAVVESGIDFANQLSDQGIVQNRHRMNGSGVATGDVNGDGRPDVFFAAMESRPSLYVNRGDWVFEHVTEQAGLGAVPNYSTGAVLADVDGDADLDLFVTVLTAPNELYLNDGAGRFEKVEAGLSSNRGSMSVALADTDGDGDLDLYVANYKRIAARDSLSPERLVFSNLVGPDGSVVPDLRDHFRVEDRAGRPLRLELGELDQYYLNQGNGTFVPADIPGVDRDWGLGARLEDLNGDQIPDLYVANDFESPDYFLLGDGRGGWLPERPRTGHTPNSSMSVAVSDVNGDGHPDLFIPDMLSPDPVRSRFEAGTAAPMDPSSPAVPQYMQNALFLRAPSPGRWLPPSNGSATAGGGLPDYAEVAWAFGIAATEWSWSAIFSDVDLDGWDDLLITTGHSFDVQDVDAQAREREAIRRVRSVDAFRALILDYPRLSLPNGAYRNVGGTRFEPVEDAWGLGVSADITHGMAQADFDGDGDLDLVTNRLNEPAGVFRNRAAGNRIAIRFALDGPNPFGIGASVTVGGRTQQMIAGGHYLSGSEPLLVFAATADSAEVEVRLRGRSKRFVAYPNRLYEIQTLSSSRDAAPVSVPTTAPLAISTLLRPPTNQPPARPSSPLIHRPLRSGPPLAVGDDVLIAGSLMGQRAAVLGGGLELPILPVRWIAAAAADDLVVALVEGAAGSTRLQSFRDGRLLQDLPLALAQPGSLALADVDGDGRVDAFVGTRTSARYPEPEPSLLLRGVSRGFEPWVGLDAGLVTGASFGDADGDGDPDLALSTEWGPVRLFLNDGGTLTDQSDAWGLHALTGLWQEVAWGDVNGDGRLDLVAGNWGWNSRYGRIGAADYTGRGLRLYAGDYDGDGRFDPVEAEFREDLGAWGPLADFATLRNALPILTRRVTTWHAFASSSIEDLFGPQDTWREVQNLASTVFINEGTAFSAQMLPDVVQYSVAQALAMHDLDGDGRDEILVAQNEYALQPPSTVRQDAGRGLLLGWDDGQWRHQSLGLSGDQEDIAFWRGTAVISLRNGALHRVGLPDGGASRSAGVPEPATGARDSP